RSAWLGRVKFEAYYRGPVRYVVRKAGVVLTVSEVSARAIREWIRDDTVQVVNAGIGCSSSFRVEGRVSTTGQPYVLYVGNVRRHKNLDVVLRALVHAPDVRLRAVVPLREAQIVSDRAKAIGVAERVDVLHGVGDRHLAALYRGAAAT